MTTRKRRRAEPTRRGGSPERQVVDLTDGRCDEKNDRTFLGARGTVRDPAINVDDAITLQFSWIRAH